MVDIVPLIIHNASILESSFLAKCELLSKNIQKLVRDIGWKKVCFIPPTYESEKCTVCHTTKRTINPFGYCSNCVDVNKYITATDAKKLWYLTDDDLEQLTTHTKWNNHYRKYIRLFMTSDVIHLSIAKHRGCYVIYQKRNKKNEVSAAKNKRQQQLEKLKLDTDPNSKKWRLCIEEFLKNGKGGIKSVRQKLERYDTYCDILKKRYDEREISILKQYIEQCLDDTTINIEEFIATKHEYHDEKKKRRTVLVERLKEHGLSLRSDSKLCDQYLEMERNDLDYIVETMREMNFLFNNTNYSNIMTNLVDDLKKDIRNSYGWLPYEEFSQMIEEEIPDISRRAKIKALRSIPNDRIPEFMHKYC